jgi:ribosome-associated toxin RatA of RatAB toxin-antitoxin module
MRTVNRSALVPFSAEAMFNLVCDVEAYPEFLPWCTASTLQSRTDHDLAASLTIGYGALNSEFSTRNEFCAPEWMTMSLLEGPFKDLEGKWVFEQLGDDGCEVTLQIEFEFSNPMKDMLFGATFETICNELIDAFVKRAHDLYD